MVNKFEERREDKALREAKKYDIKVFMEKLHKEMEERDEE